MNQPLVKVITRSRYENEDIGGKWEYTETIMEYRYVPRIALALGETSLSVKYVLVNYNKVALDRNIVQVLLST